MSERDEQEKNEYVKKMKDEYGYDDIATFFPLPGMAVYGFNAITVHQESENIEQKKAIIEGQSPVIAFTQFWESFWQQAVINGYIALGKALTDALNDNRFTDEVFRSLLDEDSMNKAGMLLIESVYSSMPDVMSVGNPSLIANVMASNGNDMAKDAVDKFLADVFKDTPKQEEE